MKRVAAFEPSPALRRSIANPPDLAPGAAWSGFQMPDVPSADWPMLMAIEQTIDRIIREVIAMQLSLQATYERVVEAVAALNLAISIEDVQRRVHAHALTYS